jgi:hypothetical protein
MCICLYYAKVQKRQRNQHLEADKLITPRKLAWFNALLLQRILLKLFKLSNVR